MDFACRDEQSLGHVVGRHILGVCCSMMHRADKDRLVRKVIDGNKYFARGYKADSPFVARVYLLLYNPSLLKLAL